MRLAIYGTTEHHTHTHNMSIIEITDKNLDKRKVIKKVNEGILDNRLKELLSASEDKNFIGRNYNEKKLGTNRVGNKSKTYRKIASIPIEIDAFFTRTYGKDYYKDKRFFKKFPEWLTVNEKDL